MRIIFISGSYDTGNIKLALYWYQKALAPAKYELLNQERNEWYEQRKQLVRKAKTHYFTVATEENEELKYLIMSTKLANIDLVVLGLRIREKYVFSMKIDLLIVEMQHLNDDDGNCSIST